MLVQLEGTNPFSFAFYGKPKNRTKAHPLANQLLKKISTLNRYMSAQAKSVNYITPFLICVTLYIAKMAFLSVLLLKDL